MLNSILPEVLDSELKEVTCEWIREQSLNEKCIKSLANHDIDIKPQVIEF